jgi:ribulose 1,5-bisphosphate synthetase/thiazole synthase
MFAGGLKKGEFSTIAAIPMGPPPTLTAAYAMAREGVNIVIHNKMDYMVRGRDDANPDA